MRILLKIYKYGFICDELTIEKKKIRRDDSESAYLINTQEKKTLFMFSQQLNKLCNYCFKDYIFFLLTFNVQIWNYGMPIL